MPRKASRSEYERHHTNQLLHKTATTAGAAASSSSTNAVVVETVTSTPHTAADPNVIFVDDDTIGGAATVNLPAVTANAKYTIKKMGSTGAVTIDADGAETIDGGLTAVLTMQYESITLIGDGTEWNIV